MEIFPGIQMFELFGRTVYYATINGCSRGPYDYVSIAILNKLTAEE